MNWKTDTLIFQVQHTKVFHPEISPEGNEMLGANRIEDISEEKQPPPLKGKWALLNDVTQQGV